LAAEAMVYSVRNPMKQLRWVLPKTIPVILRNAIQLAAEAMVYSVRNPMKQLRWVLPKTIPVILRNAAMPREK